MGILQDFIKAFEFQLFGQIGEILRFENEKGETVRLVRIATAGKTYNVPVDTDEELLKYEKAKGLWIRALGQLARRKNSTALSTRITNFVTQGQAGWKDPTESEIFAGLVFVGVAKIVSKKEGIYGGTPYRKLLAMVFGETFEFVNIDPTLFVEIPETGFAKILGHGEPKCTSIERDKSIDIMPILDAVVKLEDAASPSRPSKESKPAA